MDAGISIREMAGADAVAVARLSEELGYPVCAGVMEQRIRDRAALEDRAAFVACDGESVIGWIEVGVVTRLQVAPYADVGGLVVAGGFRGNGVGCRLVSRAEQWARDRNLNKIIVRSNIVREDAHRFYAREGYEKTKTSAVFSKELRSGP